jgi:exodeoxyribonuclease VII small subunit
VRNTHQINPNYAIELPSIYRRLVISIAYFGIKDSIMKNKTFEENLAHSKAQLEKLMDPEITLEESVKLYEEGLKTIKEAQAMIEDAKLKVEIIEKSQSGVTS